MSLSVLWFRKDFRFEDNLALAAACASKDSLLCIFHLNPEQIDENQSSKNQAAFFRSVLHFQKELAKKGLDLYLLEGDLAGSFRQLKKDFPDWHSLYYARDDHGYGYQRDKALQPLFDELGVTPHPQMGNYLHSPFEALKQDGTPYKVFTPYYKKWRQLAKPEPISVKIYKKQFIHVEVDPRIQARIEALSCPEWDFPYAPGTAAGKERFRDFLAENVQAYGTKRDFPATDGTSRMSNYLRTGELSVRMLWHALLNGPESDGKETYMKELCWRDFYAMVAANYPNQQTQAIETEFSFIDWQNDPNHFERWKAGKTGYPLVDAAMRQLATTGWMHNRLRMVAASFLVKDLLIDWRWGERYFAEQLIDFDAASNIGGWQWAASTGFDSVPYFRIFNPVRQSERFDPHGHFIREFVPELAQFTDTRIHAPHLASSTEQKQASCIIGQDYPEPIVDHQVARKLAIAAYEASKEQAKKQISSS